MKRFLCLVLCAVAYIGTSNAQSGTITGKVTSPDGNGLPGAVIEYNNTSTPDNKRHETSGANGAITLRNIAAGTYDIKITFLGYKPIEKSIQVKSGTANLGTMTFEEDAQRISTVNVDAIAIRTSQKGDTISYNANAFKVNADADVDGLLAKMPGITVSEGVVEAHGEEIKRVYLNGKEVFGDDVSAAITSIPADMVEKIEVFNKLSDDAQFTGIDDGEGFKALNIVTPADQKTIRSGRVVGSYGYADKYLLGAKLNLINDESTLILNGLFNNINQQNFSFEDILESVQASGYSSGGGRMWHLMRSQNGIATTQAIAINFNDMWGKIRTINGEEQRPIKFSGNLSFRHLDIYNENSIERWDYLSGTNRYTLTDYANPNVSDNGRYDTRLGGNIEWAINDSNQLMLRPSFNLQFSDSYSRSHNRIYNFTEDTNPIETFLMDNFSNSQSNRWGVGAGLNGNWRTRLGKPGRTLVFNFGGRYNFRNSISNPEQWLAYASNPDVTTPTDVVRVQKINGNSYSYSLNGGVTYSEPLSTQSALTIEYRANYSYSDSERLSYLALWDAQEMSPLTPPYIFDEDYDDALSSLYNSGYLTQRVTPGFRFGGEKLNFNVGISYENAYRSSNQTIPQERAGYKEYSFNNVLYSATMTYNINTTNSLRIRLNSSARNPQIEQLQDVIDDTSLMNIEAGNPDLKPSYNNRLYANYVLSNVDAGTTFSLGLSVEGSGNSIGEALTTSGQITRPDGTPYRDNDGDPIVIPTGGYFSRPQNMGGEWGSGLFTDYGFPVNFLKSNLTVGAMAYFNESPSMIDGVFYTRTNQFYNGELTLGSNISEDIDFTISYRAGYNVSTGTSTIGGQRFSKPNESFMQYANASLKWVFLQGFTFSTNAMYTQSIGITDDYNDQYCIINASIGKKFLKSQRLEISLAVNDLLNQNKSFRRSVQSTYIQNSQDLALGRYFAIQATFNLSNSKGTQNQPSQGDRRMR